MPVKVVVNGFFRSGTTIIWKILRNSNPEYDIFNEPCNDALPWYIEQAAMNGQIYSSHNMEELWNEYFQYPELIKKIKWYHPNIGKVFPDNEDKLIRYIELYDSLDKKSILHLNRGHFFLTRISQEFGCGLIHIIRNPFDVYNSTQRTYLKTGSVITRAIKYLLTPFLRGRALYINKMFNTLYPRFARPIHIADKLARAIFYFHSKDKFLISWALSNYEAIKSIRETSGMLLIYEEMLSAPSHIEKLLKEKYQIRFNFRNILYKPRRRSFITSTEYERLMERAKKLSVLEELIYVFKQCGVQ